MAFNQTRVVVNAQCSGKTASAAWLATALEAGCGVHSVYLDCAELAGDAATSVHKALSLRVGIARVLNYASMLTSSWHWLHASCSLPPVQQLHYFPPQLKLATFAMHVGG
jgi:hypothetical protein